MFLIDRDAEAVDEGVEVCAEGSDAACAGDIEMELLGEHKGPVVQDSANHGHGPRILDERADFLTVGVENGGICAEILRVAREMPADLIVMASHGPAAMDYLLGSNSSHVTLHPDCSVYVVREKAKTSEAKFMAEAI